MVNSLNKKGMESVEVWMWIIAGIIIGSLMFVAGFKMLSKYVENSENSLTQDNFNTLSSMIKGVCIGGSFNREVKSLVFPFSVSKVYVRDEDGLENYGKELCYDLRGEENCFEHEICSVTMNTINMQEKTGIFYNIQKFLGKKSIGKFRFSISKTAPGEVDVVWKQQVAE